MALNSAWSCVWSVANSLRSRSKSAHSVSDCELTETYSPAAIDIAPATRPAIPAIRIAPRPDFGGGHAYDQTGRGNDSVVRTENRGAQPTNPMGAMVFNVSHLKRGPEPDRHHNSGGLARGSRSFVVAVLGCVTNGPPSSGADLVKATSGISLASPSNGNSLRNGKNG